VPLERQDIERRDFPVSRRGYEPGAVEAHLRRVADELEQLARRRADTLSSASSEQVRAIVEAAETTSAEIIRRAREDAERARSEANAQAREHVARVSEATQTMLQRLDAIEGELGALVESLRTAANRLTADLSLVQGSAGELRVAGEPQHAGVSPEPPTLEELADEVEVEEAPESPAKPEVEAEAPAAQEGGDAEGARLIALNMALNGTPREQTDQYLADNFELEDRERLLDEVYARVG
jgi:DivIVA domain-containing protein